jgi:hypothetical protein
LFEYQTIAELAAVCGKATAVQAEQGVVTGPLPLMPYQSWILEHSVPDPHQWNMAILFEVPRKLDSALLEDAIRHLRSHHDACACTSTTIKRAGIR